MNRRDGLALHRTRCESCDWCDRTAEARLEAADEYDDNGGRADTWEHYMTGDHL